MTLPASNFSSIHGEMSRRQIPQAVLALFSFEFVFVLFLFSGQYKADPRFDWIPYDATVFWGLVNVLQGIFLVIHPRFRINQAGLPVVLFMGIFAGYVVLSTIWSDGVTYATYKAAYISTICVWCLCAGALFISSSTVRLVRFFQILVLFTAWIAIECLIFYVQNSQIGHAVQIHAMSGEGAYIGLGRAISSGGLVCAIVWLFGHSPRWGLWKSRLVTLLVLTFFVASAAITGARGPIIAAALAVLAICFFFAGSSPEISVMKKVRRIGGMLLVSYLFACLYQTLLGDLPLVVQRFLAFSGSSQYFDLSGQSYFRLELFTEAFHAWLDHPMLGHGIGSFPVVWAHLDERLFPHNLVLEILCELGIVGLVLFLAVPWAAYVLTRRERLRADVRLVALVIAFALYAVANAMTSGDLPDNRAVFFAIGLLAFRVPKTQLSGNSLAIDQSTLRHRPRNPRILSPPRTSRGVSQGIVR